MTELAYRLVTAEENKQRRLEHRLRKAHAHRFHEDEPDDQCPVCQRFVMARHDVLMDIQAALTAPAQFTKRVSSREPLRRWQARAVLAAMGKRKRG